jgi:negative regulator of genetic competence, sporulation and motility
LETIEFRLALSCSYCFDGMLVVVVIPLNFEVHIFVSHSENELRTN